MTSSVLPPSISSDLFLFAVASVTRGMDSPNSILYWLQEHFDANTCDGRIQSEEVLLLELPDSIGSKTPKFLAPVQPPRFCRTGSKAACLIWAVRASRPATWSQVKCSVLPTK
jgi:hypothetical protein